jgi:hypothetical protein
MSSLPPDRHLHYLQTDILTIYRQISSLPLDRSPLYLQIPHFLQTDILIISGHIISLPPDRCPHYLQTDITASSRQISSSLLDRYPQYYRQIFSLLSDRYPHYLWTEILNTYRRYPYYF